MNYDKIYINLWDDYAEEEGGETGFYIETGIKKKDVFHITSAIFDLVAPYKPKGVVMSHDGRDISFRNLTHKKRIKFIKDLTSKKLKYKDIQLIFYSES